MKHLDKIAKEKEVWVAFIDQQNIEFLNSIADHFLSLYQNNIDISVIWNLHYNATVSISPDAILVNASEVVLFDASLYTEHSRYFTPFLYHKPIYVYFYNEEKQLSAFMKHLQKSYQITKRQCVNNLLTVFQFSTTAISWSSESSETLYSSILCIDYKNYKDVNIFNQICRNLDKEIKKYHERKVFISYAHEDIKFVEKLAKELRKRGLYVWLDEWNLNVGDSIVNKIDQAFKECKYKIIVFSDHSIKREKGFFLQERDSIIMQNINNSRQTKLLPIIIDKCEVPPIISSLYYADFSTDFDFGLGQLLKSIE